MTDIDVEVTGIEELQQELERIVTDIERVGLVGGIRDATLLVQRDAKRNSPVDTGRLRASITPELRRKKDRVIGVVGTNVDYAPLVEEPGPVRGVGRRPYLEPSLMENRDRIIAIIERAIGRAIT